MYEAQKNTLKIIRENLKKGLVSSKCINCNKDFILRSFIQKHCIECQLERKLKIARVSASKSYYKNPEKFKKISSKNYKKQKKSAKENGKIISDNDRFSILDEVRPKLKWVFRFFYPFSYNLSKNALLGKSKYGGMYKKTEARKAQDEIIGIIEKGLSDNNIKIAKNKLWIKFLVEKPNQKGDAINVIDTICDAIKKAIKLDDRWFSIRGLDWKIVKENPNVLIEIGQESDEDVGICLYCGRLLLLNESNFNRRKHSKTGFTTECKQCITSKEIQAKKYKDNKNPRVEIELEILK
jgi:hypothetical protein